MSLTEADIKRIVKETLREEREAHAEQEDLTVVKTISAILSGFGIDEDERKDIKEDFRYVRRWRKGAERVTGMTLTSIIAILAGGLVSALGLGIKAMLGK
jgi:hypothetical protein